MLVVRYGTCGVLRPEVAVGSVVVASHGSIKVLRNPDHFLPDACPRSTRPYLTFRPQPADPLLSQAIARELEVELGGGAVTHVGVLQNSCAPRVRLGN